MDELGDGVFSLPGKVSPQSHVSIIRRKQTRKVNLSLKDLQNLRAWRELRGSFPPSPEVSLADAFSASHQALPETEKSMCSEKLFFTLNRSCSHDQLCSYALGLPFAAAEQVCFSLYLIFEKSFICLLSFRKRLKSQNHSSWHARVKITPWLSL